MPNSETAVGAAIDYLIAGLHSTLPDGAEVVDGDPRVLSPKGYVTITGWESGEQEPAALGTGFSLDEFFEVVCLIRTWTGEIDQKASRDRAIEILNGVQDFVRQDPTFGGLLLQAWIVRHSGQQGETDKGGVATEIPLAIHCQARITRYGTT